LIGLCECFETTSVNLLPEMAIFLDADAMTCLNKLDVSRSVRHKCRYVQYITHL